MSLVLSDARHVLDDARGRLRHRQEAIAHVAELAVRIARRSAWPRLAGAAALGLVAGVALVSSRKAVTQAAAGLSGDWFAALKADHKAVDGLFEILMKTEDHEGARRQLLFSKIADALARHEFEEEHVIYPALLKDGPAETPRHLDAEHFEMKRFVHELAALPMDDAGWLPKARALHRLIRAHVREEEEIVFPRLKETLTKAQSARMTRDLRREGAKVG